MSLFTSFALIFPGFAYSRCVVLLRFSFIFLFYLQKKNFEGPIFVVQRSQPPRYRMILLNKMAREDFSQDIDPSSAFEFREQYVRYRFVSVVAPVFHLACPLLHRRYMYCKMQETVSAFWFLSISDEPIQILTTFVL